MRITCVLPALDTGGAQRVLTDLMNSWVDQGRSVTLVTLSSGSEGVPYPLDARIVRVPLGVLKPSATPVSGAFANLKRIVALRTELNRGQPDVVVAFLMTTNLITLLASVGARWRTVVSERVYPPADDPGKVWRALRRLIYPLASQVVVQTQDARNYYSYLQPDRVSVIPNMAVDRRLGTADEGRSAASTDHVVTSLGRLVLQKGFDLLIRAFADLAPRHPDWSLEIWGEGPERTALECLVQEMGLAGRVRLPGETRTPGEVLRGADLFVLSSRFEGFPNVLSEAMAAGLPVVSFDCPAGPSDLIRPGVDGVLVPTGDTDSLATAVELLMSDESERRRLGNRAREVLTRFSRDRILALWDEVLAPRAL